MSVRVLGRVPAQVLSDALQEAIDGRPVRAAVFTTFSFDPGFFELHILPLLFDRDFSQVDKVRLIQLEECLRSIEHVAVYYDRTALSQDAGPARLDVRRIDVRRKTGVFHPKVALLLVENPPDDDDDVTESLVVGVLSANLTRGGWWETIETAHFEEVGDRDDERGRVPYRRDLLSLIARVKNTADEREDHAALDRIHKFLLRRVSQRQFTNVSSQRSYFTRLFVGQSSLPEWLSELRFDKYIWNLEVLSPFFDQDGADTLERLIDVVRPSETRVYLPRSADGTPEVTSETYEKIKEIAYWSELPGEISRRSGSGSAETSIPRRLHAKVYRIWHKRSGDVLLVGSVNLTRAAHSHGSAGNLEAAFLVDVSDAGLPKRWWLQRLEGEETRFAERSPETTLDAAQGFIDFGLKYDWSAGDLWYRAGQRFRGPMEIREPGGRWLFAIETVRSGGWYRCAAEEAKKVVTLLPSTSFVLVRHERRDWRILVREEGMAHRPSLLARLTPEEILRYWSLLTPEQRTVFIEHKLATEGTLEGLPIARTERLQATETIFDRFAGLYHAFNAVERTVIDALEDDRWADAESRLLGAKFDSVPTLLERYLEREDSDPVMRYVAFLSARQLWERVRKDDRDFGRAMRKSAGRLEGLLDRTRELRDEIELPTERDRETFLDWYEEQFLKSAALPEDAS